jgi:hypothetical protein
MQLGLRITKQTGNTKLTGATKEIPFGASYRAVGFTCPSSCPLLNNGCYAQNGNTAMHQRDRYSENDAQVMKDSAKTLKPNSYFRHHVSGDLFITNSKDGSLNVDTDYLNAVLDVAKERPDVTFYSYTHGYKSLDNLPEQTPKNLTINASCDNLEQVKDAKNKGWATVIVVSENEKRKRYNEDGIDIVVCPNQTSSLTCSQCKLCFKQDRKFTVAFQAHGASKKKISKRLESVELPTV